MFVAAGDAEDGEPERYERPAWLGPPAGELGRAVDVAQIVARSDAGLIALAHAVAYTTGVSLTFYARVSGLKPGEMHTIYMHQHGGVSDPDELPDAFMRIGVEVPGGARASNMGRRSWDPEAEPEGPLLMMHGGGGGQTSAREAELHPGYWLWPLPQPGVLKLSCEWPIAGIPFTTVELDAAPLREAAARAIAL